MCVWSNPFLTGHKTIPLCCQVFYFLICTGIFRQCPEKFVCRVSIMWQLPVKIQSVIGTQCLQARCVIQATQNLSSDPFSWQFLISYMASQGAWARGTDARYLSIQLYTEANAFSTTSTAERLPAACRDHLLPISYQKQLHSGSIHSLYHLPCPHII